MTERNEQTSKTISSNAAKLIHITAEQLLDLDTNTAEDMAAQIRSLAASALTQTKDHGVTP